MLDFNTKKDILRRLRLKGEKSWYWRFLCGTAAIFVKIWFAVGCTIGMAFSDKNGNFLGIKGSEEKRERTRRQDDIVYVKKPVLGRFLSAVLAASFVLMFVPELGIDLSVFAAAGDAYVTVHYPDGDKYFLVDTERSIGNGYTYMYSYDDYRAVTKVTGAGDAAYTVSAITADSFDIADRAVIVHWDYTCGPIGVLKGFRIEVTEQITGSRSTTFELPDYMETYAYNPDRTVVSFETPITVSEGLKWDEKAQIRVEISPIIELDEVQAVGNYSAGDEIGGDGSVDSLVGAASTKYRVDRSRGAKATPSDSVPFNAKFDPKDLNLIVNVLDEEGNSSEDCYDTSAKLQWNTVYQHGGGVDENTVPADGYIIYRKEGNGKFQQLGKPIPAKATDPQSYTDNDLLPGVHYQYFVEAYRIVWGGSYNTTNVGMVTSSGIFVTSDGDGKYSSVYSDYTKNLYVAPYTPELSVTPSTQKNTIDLSWRVNNGDYTGVVLYRTTGESSELDPDKLIADGLMDPDERFADWLRKNVGKYGIERIHEFAKGENSYDDDRIISGETYWYYAVAYLAKSGTRWLYGDVTKRSSRLDLDLKAPLSIVPENGDGKVKLTWEPVAGAKGYEIAIRKISSRDYSNEGLPEESFEIIDVGNKTEYLHNFLYNGDTYEYKVRAYINIRQKTEDGEEPAVISPWTKERRVTVGLPFQAPQNVSATTADGQVTITWDKAEGATSYTLFYTNTTTGETGSFGGLTKETYTHKNLINNHVYSYYVVAYKDIPGDGSYGTQHDPSDPSNPITIKVGIPLDTPQDMATTTTDGQVVITWSKVPGATGYKLYILGPNDTEPQEIDVTNPPYVHAGLHNGDIYEYWVVPYKMVSGVDVMGPSSVHIKQKVGEDLGIPQDVKTTTKDGEVTITWTAVPGAEGYTLHIIDQYGGTSEVDVTKSPFTHVGLTNGDVYTYYVTAYKTVNGIRVYGGDSVKIKQRVGDDLGIPQDLKATTKDGEITVSWSAVAGAEGYILYYRCNYGSWNTIDLSRTSFNHTQLKNGDIYEYYVRAYKTVNGSRVLGAPSVTISMTVGSTFDAPKDFQVVTTDGKADLSWSKVNGAEGYIIYAYSSGRAYQFDVTKEKYTHSGLANGDTWTYYVVAYKTVNGEKVYSAPTKSITVTIGVSLNAAVDLVATAGNHQIDLMWTAVAGAEGYVVYLYNNKTMEFEPIAVVSKPGYSHVGVKNGQKYTYMVASFKTVNGERVYGDYSIAVSAIPTTGSTTDIDRTLNVKGTAPYGISHSEYISAKANHDAFDETVDVYFSTNNESTEAVKDVLKHYAEGLSSFVVYPFDISIYQENTLIEVDPADGYTVTITMPVPDLLIPYRDYLTVIHVSGEDEETEEVADPAWYEVGDQNMEVLPCAIIEINNVWCVQFKCSSFSPYAFVIYKEHIQDVSAGDGIFDGSFAGTFNTGGLLLFTALPDIMPHNKKLRVVRGTSKRYRIKNVTKK